MYLIMDAWMYLWIEGFRGCGDVHDWCLAGLGFRFDFVLLEGGFLGFGIWDLDIGSRV